MSTQPVDLSIASSIVRLLAHVLESRERLAILMKLNNVV